MRSLLLAIAFLPCSSDNPSSSPGGVNKATFDKIKPGMTPKEIQALIGRRKAALIFRFHGYSESELWSNEDDTKRIWVEYEPTVANGKTTRASFMDYSTPFAENKSRRVATKEECAAVIDQLVADAKTQKPLGYSDAFTKEIPVNGPRATTFINGHPGWESYHLLMALQGTNPVAYKAIPATVRASVLCSTLKEQRFFDDWAPPDSAPTFVRGSEKALIECGTPAIAYLFPLLDDRRDASESEYEGEREDDNRRADYAFRYVCQILKLPYEFQPEVADRDKDIRAAKQSIIDARLDRTPRPDQRRGKR